MVAFAQDDPREALSNGRTFDYEETIRLTQGHRLWSNRSRILFEIEADSVGTHDFPADPVQRSYVPPFLSRQTGASGLLRQSR
jgi:uncharacterized protein YcgI (DUF1989 family)